MTFEEIPRSLQSLMIVLMPRYGYVQNPLNDCLLGPGFTFAREISETVATKLSHKSHDVRIFSFGAHAFRDAGSIITSRCEKSWKSSEYPLASLDPKIGTSQNYYSRLLHDVHPDFDKNCEIFLRYLMDLRTSGADAAVLVTGQMVGTNIARFLCSVVKIGAPDSNPLYDPTLDLRLIRFSFVERAIGFELIQVE